MLASEDPSQQQLHFLQSCGFGGLWRFAGPFTKYNIMGESSELFVNCLEAMVETCLPCGDMPATGLTAPRSHNLSSSLSSLTLGSPNEKGSKLLLKYYSLEIKFDLFSSLLIGVLG